MEGSPLLQPVLSPLPNYSPVKPTVKRPPGTTSRPNLITNLNAFQWFGLSDFCGCGVKRGPIHSAWVPRAKLGCLTWVHPSRGNAEAPDGWGLRASVELAVDAHGVEISARHLQLHLGFTSSRRMLFVVAP